MKIVVDDKIPYLEGVLERYFDEVVYLPGKSIRAAYVRDADALLVRTRTRCDRALLEGSSVRAIATATIGFDHIDRQYCLDNGVAWFNAPGCNAFGVVQYVLSALAHLAMTSGESLNGKTLGIVGVGEVGKRIAAVAPSLGLRVLQNDPPRSRAEGGAGFVDLATICRESDIISFHTPLNRDGADKTYHLANEAFFSSLVKPVVLINASRGEVVETKALKRAIQEGMVADAILDVWENEPDIDRELLQMVSVATPHIAGYSVEGKANGTAAVVNALLRFLGMNADAAWYPSNLPELGRYVELPNNAADEVMVLSAIAQTYRIMSDDAALRATPDAFEQLRGCYGTRHEISYYRVKNNITSELAERLKALTFEVK